MSENQKRSEITEEQIKEAAKILGIDFPSLYETIMATITVEGENAKIKYPEQVCAVIRHADGAKEVIESGDSV